MSTNDVPGANSKNFDVLRTGCWAEHDDGSLLFVKGTEGGQVVYDLYDVIQDPVVYYQDAMLEDSFKRAFSYPPIGTSADKWTWHDKTPFPWDRVMKAVNRPTPIHADVNDTLSAAQRVAESLRLRGKQLTEDDIDHKTDKIVAKTKSFFGRLEKAIAAFKE